MVRRERSGSFPSLAIYAIMKFAARPARDVEDAVPYCGAGHIIDSRFSNIPKFRRGQVTTPYRLFHPPSHISNSLNPIFSERRTAPRSPTIILYYLFFIIYSLLFILYYLFFIHSNSLLQLLTFLFLFFPKSFPHSRHFVHTPKIHLDTECETC